MAEPADPPDPPRRRRLPPARLALLVVTGMLSAIAIVFGAIIAVTPCGGNSFCFSELGWIAMLAGALLLGAGLLFAYGWTAAPMYVIGAYIGGGLTIQRLLAQGSPPDPLFAALFGLGLVALLDLRRQTRSTFAAAAAVIALGLAVPIDSRYPVTGWIILGLGVLPMVAWAYIRARDLTAPTPGD
jgi:hypothetical protein